MLDAAILSEPTPTPDSDRADIRKAVPAGIAQVLYVVRFLISFTCHMGRLAEECSMRSDIRPATMPFPKTIEGKLLTRRTSEDHGGPRSSCAWHLPRLKHGIQ